MPHEPEERESDGYYELRPPAGCTPRVLINIKIVK